MTVKNTTAGSIGGIILRRQVDFDVDTGGANVGPASPTGTPTTRQYTSAFAFNDPSLAPAGAEAHAMMLQYAGNFARVTSLRSPATSSTRRARRARRSPRYRPTGTGDTQQFQIGTLAAGAQVTAAVRYIGSDPG